MEREEELGPGEMGAMERIQRERGGKWMDKRRIQSDRSVKRNADL